MPLDPSIILGGRAPAPVQTPSPLDLLGTVERVQSLREQTELRRLAGEKARQAAADDAQVRSVFAAHGDDVDAAIADLYRVNPRAAGPIAEQIGKARKEQLDAAGKGLDNQKKQLEHYTNIWGLVKDDSSLNAIRPLFVKAFPTLDPVLPTEYGDGSDVQRVSDLALTRREQLEQKQNIVKLFGEGKVNEAIGTGLSMEKTAEGWNRFKAGAKAMGAPQEILDAYGDWSPEAPAAAAQRAITPKERETLEGQAATRAQTEQHQTTQEDLTRAGQAQTAHHQTVLEQQGAARLALERDAQQAGLGALTPEALALTAHQYAMTGQLPPMGMGKQGAAIRTAIINKAADTYKNLDLPTQIAAYKANQASLTKLQGTADKVQAFESTAGKNLDQFLALADKVPDTGIPWLNQPVRAINAALLGSQNQAAFNAARDVALREIARVTNDPNLSGVLSDSARREVSALSPDTATFAQIKAVAKVLKQDMANVRAGLGTQIGDIQQRIATPPGGTPSAAPAATPSPAGGAALTYQDYLRSKGGR